MGDNRKPIRISLEEAKKHFDSEQVVMLDVVDSHVYDRFDFQIVA